MDTSIVSMINKFKWEELRSSYSSSSLPKALKILASSEDKDELDAAYWNIDNEAIVQGTMYQAAYPVVCCLLEIFDVSKLNVNKCAARPFILELLQQFVAGTPAPSEIELGNAELSKNIKTEILKFTPHFFQILDNGDRNEKDLCIDILFWCALADASLKPKVREKFTRLKDSPECPDMDMKELLKGNLADLE